MLLELHVRDLALVEDLSMEFGPGLTVLTGETGAGKTVLVSALKLLLGERADSTMVRGGAAEALVEGRFLIDGREILVKRRLSAEGRSRCTVDGEMVTVAMLGDVLGPHVDLHGQHEHQALLAPANHAGYLDRFVGAEAISALEDYRVAWRRARAARTRIEDIERSIADRDRRLDYLEFQLAEIDSVAPRPGEDEELQAELPRLRHGERLTGAGNAAWMALSGEDGAIDHLSVALQALGSARSLDPALDALAADAERMDVELGELAISLRDYAEEIDHDPGALDSLERRLQALVDLRRKYGGTIADVIAMRDAAAREIEALRAHDEDLAQLREELVTAELTVREAAQVISAARGRESGRFTERLADAVADLALPGASFAVRRTPHEYAVWTVDGPESVEFLFSAHAGEEPRGLHRIASGGEISRVMLALKSVLGDADSVDVLVFDEVDAGIGGATGLAVGRRLALLAATHQVLVVTHLPQVAAYADAQVVVTKGESQGRAVTTVTPVSGDGRVLEIARMLAGGDSEAGKAHARELLDIAATGRAGER